MTVLGIFFPNVYRKIGRVFDTIEAYFDAKKHGVCPPVTPPSDFKK